MGAIVGALAGNTVIGAAVGTAVGAGAGAIIGHKMDKAKKEAEAIQNAQVEEVKDANGLDAVKVTFASGILFDTGKDKLSNEAKTSLQQLAGVLKGNSDCDVILTIRVGRILQPSRAPRRIRNCRSIVQVLFQSIC